MNDFHVGQRVVCINDSGGQEFCPWKVAEDAGLDGLQKGCVYTVRSVLTEHGVPTLELQEIPRFINPRWKHACRGFHQARFRPLEEKPDTIEIFRAIANGGDIRPGGDHLDTRELEPEEIEEILFPATPHGRPILSGRSA